MPRRCAHRCRRRGRRSRRPESTPPPARRSDSRRRVESRPRPARLRARVRQPTLPGRSRARRAVPGFCAGGRAGRGRGDRHGRRQPACHLGQRQQRELHRRAAAPSGGMRTSRVAGAKPNISTCTVHSALGQVGEAVDALRIRRGRTFLSPAAPEVARLPRHGDGCTGHRLAVEGDLSEEVGGRPPAPRRQGSHTTAQTPRTASAIRLPPVNCPRHPSLPLVQSRG